MSLFPHKRKNSNSLLSCLSSCLLDLLCSFQGPLPVSRQGVVYRLTAHYMCRYSLSSQTHSVCFLFTREDSDPLIYGLVDRVCALPLYNRLVGSSGLEPPTLRLSGVRSNQLSYEPIRVVYRTLKIEQYEPRRLRTPSRTVARADRPSCYSLSLYRKRPIDLGYDRPRSPPCLPRKEVIQPHLPIRLPCYDFTPIIYPTFGSVPLIYSG